MAGQSPTRPGRLSDLARHLVLPSGLATTGWPTIERRLGSMGVKFDPWQEDVAKAALAKRKNGKYAATVGGVVLSVPRQVGKTFMVGALLFAMCIEHPGMLVLWTAHHTRTSGETFLSMQGMARRAKIAPHVEHAYRGSGVEAVHFANGSRILFGARENGFGRGFAAVDVLVFDEAQILTDRALDDMIPSTNRAKHEAGALLFFIGTPPKPTDKGEAFAAKRNKALSGKSDDMVYVELSADKNPDPDDREQWAKANPSYPQHTSTEAMLRMRENLGTDEAFIREGLGVWDAEGTGGVIPAQSWLDAGDEHSFATQRLALGVEVAPDMARASVALAGLRDDGDWHVELDEAREGAAWVVPYVKALLEANPLLRGVGVDAGSPAKALLPEFERAGIHVITPKVQDLGAACSSLLAGVVAGTVRHIRQGQLGTAVAGASKRDLADTGLWVWHRASAAVDITPVQAVTLALWVAQLDKIWKKPLRRRNGDSQRRAVVIS